MVPQSVKALSRMYLGSEDGGFMTAPSVKPLAVFIVIILFSTFILRDHKNYKAFKASEIIE